MDEWTRITPENVAKIMGPGPFSKAVSDSALKILEGAGAVEQVRTVVVFPDLPEGVLGAQVPHTNVFVRLRDWTGLRGDAMLAAATYVATGSLPLAAATAALRRILGAIELLDEDEGEVVRAFFENSRNKPYGYPIPKAQLQSSFVDGAIDFDSVLARLVRRGVVQDATDGRFELIF